MRRPKLQLAHLPTPLVRCERLDSLLGCEIWFKRDDASAGAEAGNKVRKLEYLLADARDRHANHVITCGGAQSNHARATALCAARLGMKTTLLLRHAGETAPARVGNLALDGLVGADVRLVTPDEYAQRGDRMQAIARELSDRGDVPYVIPEGGSNALGSLAYYDAAREIRAQLDVGLGGGPQPFDAVVHACGSGGTAAGLVLGARYFRVADRVISMAVCDDVRTFERIIGRLVLDAEALLDHRSEPAELELHDRWKGPAYAEPSAAQWRFIADVARAGGVVLDPVYTGKALFGLAQLDPKPARILFVHTGGLPGLLARADDLPET